MNSIRFFKQLITKALSYSMIVILLITFISCDGDNDTSPAPSNSTKKLSGTYAMLTHIGETYGMQGDSYLQAVHSYGEAVSNKKAFENTKKGTIATFKNYVFFASFFSGDIKKYRKNKDNSLTLEGELGVPGVADMIVLNETKGYILQNKFHIIEFNPTTFKITKKIDFVQYNDKSSEYNFTRTGEICIRKSDNKLFIPIHYINNRTFTKIHQQVTIVVIDANTNTVEKLITDDRTYSPGMFIGSGSSGLSIDDKGDIYIVCSSGFGFNKNPPKNPGILRIKKGTTEIDPDYFFDLRKENIGVCLSLLCVGNGEAYTFRRNDDLIPNFTTKASSAAAYKPIKINLNTQKMVEEVKGYTGTQSLNGIWLTPAKDKTKCYIPQNNREKNKTGVYELDLSTNTATKLFSTTGAVTSFKPFGE